MTGELIMLWDNGWGCTNEARIETHKEPVRDINGSILMVPMKRTNVATANELYTLHSDPVIGQNVECVLKLETGHKVSFTGVVNKIVGKTIIINMTSELGNSAKEIIIKIKKSWQE